MPKKKTKKAFDDLKEVTFLAVDGTERKVGDFFLASDFKKSQDGKQLFVSHESLQRVFRTIFNTVRYTPSVLESPKKTNEWCAVIEVEYNFNTKGEDNKFLYGATADCRTSNASSFREYTTAVAETRASARALRGILGISVCSIEEAKDLDEMADNSEDKPTGPQIMMIEKKMLKEKQWTVTQLSEIIGREIEDVNSLTRGEATQIIDKYNS